uniref:Uncharacterized protein n=1 Tax=Anguilla anguilla TaxID=7936 RepID=A0A0E9STR2_ANGAN
MYQNEIQYFVYLKYKDTFLAPRFYNRSGYGLQ